MRKSEEEGAVRCSTCPRKAFSGLVTVVITMLAMIVAVACLGAYVPMAAAEESDSIAAPDTASQVWIDVEYIDDVTVEGTLNDEALDFSSSPSGSTAITEVSAGTAYTLTLSTASDLDAFVAVTFADSDGVVLKELTSTAELGSEPTIVTFETSSGSDESGDNNSNSGSNSEGSGSTSSGVTNNDGVNADTNANGEGEAEAEAGNEETEESLSATGVQIAVIAAIAVLLCAAGGAVFVIRNRRQPAHAAAYFGINGKEEM